MSRTAGTVAALAADVAAIGSAASPLPERAAAILEQLRQVVPFQGGWLALYDPDAGAYQPLAWSGYSERIRRYLTAPGHAATWAANGLVRHHPLRLRDLGARLAELRGWTEYLLPAGYRDGVVLGLFATDGRHLGVLGLSTDTDQHPDQAACHTIGVLGPVIGAAVDPYATVAAAAGLVQHAEAAVVVHRSGAVTTLPGLPGGPLLAAGSPVVAAALHPGLAGNRYRRMLCACPTRPDSDCFHLVTVLTCADCPPHHLAAAVVLSGPAELRGLLRGELELVGMLAAGWSVRRAAAAIACPPGTVAEILAGLAAKLGRDPDAAVAWAVHAGLYLPAAAR